MEPTGTRLSEQAGASFPELRPWEGVPAWFDPRTLYLPDGPETDGPARIEALTMEGERDAVPIRTRADARLLAGTLAEQAGYGLTGFGLDRLEQLTGSGWLDIEAGGILAGVMTSVSGDETHLSGKVDITRPGALTRTPRYTGPGRHRGPRTAQGKRDPRVQADRQATRTGTSGAQRRWPGSLGGSPT